MSQASQTTLTATLVLAANTPLRGVTLATFRPESLAAAVSEGQVPSGEIWVVNDVWIAAAADVPAGADAIIRIEKNRRDIKAETSELSTLLVSNNSRPKLSVKVGYKPFEIMRFQGVNTAAIGGAPLTDTFRIEILKTVTRS